LLQHFRLIGAFSRERDVVATEVAVGGGFATDGLTQFQVTDDRARVQQRALGYPAWVRRVVNQSKIVFNAQKYDYSAYNL
jgi:hypothetical protein